LLLDELDDDELDEDELDDFELDDDELDDFELELEWLFDLHFVLFLCRLAFAFFLSLFLSLFLPRCFFLWLPFDSNSPSV